MAPPVKGLSALQLKFVAAILEGKSQRAAAVAAGCSPEGNGASVTASRWMKLPHVLKAIESAQLAVLRRAKIDAGYVLDKSVALVERCMQEVKPALHPKTRKQMHDEDGNALYTFNAAGAIAALRLVGDNVKVQAFEENIRLTAGESLVERLRAGRNRARPMIDVTPNNHIKIVVSRDPTPDDGGSN